MYQTQTEGRRMSNQAIWATVGNFDRQKDYRENSKKKMKNQKKRHSSCPDKEITRTATNANADKNVASLMTNQAIIPGHKIPSGHTVVCYDGPITFHCKTNSYSITTTVF